VYHVVFSDSPAVDFGVVDATTGETKLTSYPINTPDMPVVDGFRVVVHGDETFGGVKEVLDEYGRNVLGADHTDTTGSWYVEVLEKWGDFDAKTSDYEIRFTAEGSKVGVRIGRKVEIAEWVPFEVWNVTFGQRVTAVVLDDGDREFDEGERMYIVNLPYQDLEIGQTYDLDIKAAVPYQVTIENADSDTLGRPPIEGQKILIRTSRAHTPDDLYEIRFEGYSFGEYTESDLAGIRVVPNPYVVNAAWERAMNVRRIEFMYLPPECTIKVYTTRGELVKTLHHNSGTGSLDWNLTSDNNQDLAFGVYIYVVETPDGKKFLGKFALIK